MAKEDFCFTYYDGDAARDKSHMNRLERGAYDDIISAQRKKGHLTEGDIKKVLGRDFEACWAALEWVLKKDGDRFFIEWVDKSVTKSKENSKKQKAKIEKYWADRREKEKNDSTEIQQNNNSIELEEPLEDGNENGYGNNKKEKERDGIVIYKPEKLIEELENTQWLENVAITLKIDPWWNFEQLKVFAADLKIKGGYGRILAEIKIHFYNWIKIQIKNNVKSTSKNGKQSSNDKQAGVDALADELRKSFTNDNSGYSG